MNIMIIIRFKILLQLTLLGIFTYFFGVPSLIKYHESKMLISVSQHTSDSIPSPAVTICGKDLDTKTWGDVNSLDSALDSCNSSDNVFKCVQNKAWAIEDVVLGAQKGYNLKENIMNNSLWQTEFLKEYSCFTFESTMMVGTNYYVDELHFFLNNRMAYKIYIHSATFFLPNVFSEVLVNGFEVIPPKDCKRYFRLTLTETQELNTADDPCEAEAGYSFTRCVEKSIATKVGCGLGRSREPICYTKEQYR